MEEAECNPWCLRKLYLATRSEIERNVRLPAEQAYEQILDAEQLAAGWTENESNSIQKDVCDRYFLAERCKGGEEMKKRILSALMVLCLLLTLLPVSTLAAGGGDWRVGSCDQSGWIGLAERPRRGRRETGGRGKWDRR